MYIFKLCHEIIYIIISHECEIDSTCLYTAMGKKLYPKQHQENPQNNSQSSSLNDHALNLNMFIQSTRPGKLT